MDFVAIVDQVIALLRQRGRLTYRTLKRQFALDDAALEDLKEELIYGQRLAVDEDERVLVWMGETAAPTPPASGRATAVDTSQGRAPLTYTPPYLAEKILTSRSALEGERKPVTVLFADLKGSMELLADRDPEEARQLLDPVLERMMAAVHRYEGTVNQVMGDGIMALFGAPLAHEDHAVRACYAALAMQAAVQQYAAEVQRTHGVPLQMRVGLNAGEVVVRAIGNDLHMDYSAIGQTTHLAARMEQMAMPGTSLITSAVLALAEGYVQVRPLGLMPAQRRQRLLDALKRVLLRESQVQPLLLVFEDLHWIDTETQALLDRLVDSLPTARLLLLVNYRPEYQHGWSNKTSYTQLRLDALAPASADEVLQALLGDDPSLAPLRPRLIARTEGNPFFLEESVRALAETGVLVGARGAHRLANALQSLQVPATVQAVLAARIDRLQPEEKRLLQTAAVLGMEVPLLLLQAIAEAPEESLERSLAHLQAAEFLYETRLFPEHEYTFKHALTHEVTYGSLLLERRRVLHARIVQALEALAGDRVAEQVERLAHHALRGEVWDKALAYCRQAGEKALARSAYREAVGSFEQALHALPHLPEQRDMREQAIDLRLALRSALLPSGDEGRILAYLREAESLATALDDPMRLGQVSRFLSTHFYLIGAYDQAITSAQCALTLATAGGDVVLHALANLRLGLAYLAQGDYRQAIDCFRQTVAALDGVRRYERFGHVILPAVLSRAHLTWCYAELGTFAEGRALGEEGLRIAEAVAHPGSLMYASWEIGLLALRQGNLSRALPLLERAVGICHEADIPFSFPEIAAVLGAAYTLAGRVADAVPLLTRAIEQPTAKEIVRYQVLCSLSLSESQVLAGHLEEAHALAEGALTLAGAHQERGHLAYALRLLGEIASHRDPPEAEQAEAHYRQALALAAELGMRPLQAHCHRSLGTLYAVTGRRQQARTALSTAIALYRDMDMAFWLPQTEAALAQVG